MVYFLFLLMIQQLFFFKNVHIGNSYYFSNKFYFPFNFNIPFQFPLFIFFQDSHFYASLLFIHLPPHIHIHGHSQWPPVGSSWRDIIWGSGNAAENRDIEGGFFFPSFPHFLMTTGFFFSPPPQKKTLVIPSLLKFVGWDESDINHSTSCSSSSSSLCTDVAGLDEFGRHLALLFKSTCQL